MTTPTQAWQDGHSAYGEGENNPYSLEDCPEEWQSWNNGYAQARLDAEEASWEQYNRQG